MRNCKTGYGKNKKYSGAKGVTGTGLRRFKEKCLDWLGLLEQLVTVKVRRSRSRTKKKTIGGHRCNASKSLGSAKHLIVDFILLLLKEIPQKFDF